VKRVAPFQGFTLLELLIVVVIVSILASAALPMYMRSIARARESEGWQFLGAIRAAELRYYLEHEESRTAASGDLDLENAAASPLFNYRISIGAASDPAGTFTVCADPSARCFFCRGLVLWNNGRASTRGPGPNPCP